jgi:acyl dehydratase
MHETQKETGYSVNEKISFTDEMLKDFTSFSGDISPLHTNDGFAQAHGFKKKVIHGAAIVAMVSRVLGTKYPGPNWIWLKSDVKYHNPCHAPCVLNISIVVQAFSVATDSIVLKIEVSDSSSLLLTTIKSYHKELRETKTP